MKENYELKFFEYLSTQLDFGCVSERHINFSHFDDSKCYVVVVLKPFRQFSSAESCFIRSQVLESDYLRDYLPKVHLKTLLLNVDIIKAVYIIC